MDETATARVTGVAQVFDLHALKAFAPDRRVRKMLFKTDQLWSEIACYEPGQSTVMHQHPREEEAIFVLEGTAHMSIDGQEVVVPAGSIVKFPQQRAPRRAQPGARAVRDHVPQGEPEGAARWVTWSAATRPCRSTR